MEHVNDLLKPKAGAGKRSGKTKRRSMRRFMAMLLSVVLAAGTCLPAMAAEQIQAEEASGAASTDAEQAAEVQPEDNGNEVVTEGTSSEVTVNSEETAGQVEDPADDSAETAAEAVTSDEAEIAAEAVTSDEAEIAAEAATSDETEIAAEAATSDETEIAAEAVTSAATEITAEEEPKAGADASGNLLDAEGNSSWLADYSYYLNDLEDGTAVVCLSEYHGADTEIEVPGTAQVEGVTYPVSMESYVWQDGVESLTFGEGFIFREDSSYLFSNMGSLISVDLSQADTSRVRSMYNMFEYCSNLREVNLGSIDVSNVANVSFMFYNCSSIEELDMSCFSENGAVEDVDRMFYGCSNLKRLNLGGWNWSQIYSAWELLEDCNKLEELVTPSYFYGDSIPLPCTMADQNGNIYVSFPSGIESVTLTPIEVPEWLDEYDYYVNSEEGKVFLQAYNGSAAEITMPESVILAGKEYLVKIQSAPWKTGVTKLSFEGGNPFDDYSHYALQEMDDLEVLDLRNVDCTEDNFQSLDRCRSLQTIYLPANCPWRSQLPREFRDENNNYYDCLPYDIPNSVRLDAGTCDEWLKDYTYNLYDDEIILTGYYGDILDLVIPGSASIDGTQYPVRITRNVWDDRGPGSGLGGTVSSLKFENGVRFGYETSSGNSAESVFSGMNVESLDFSEVGGYPIYRADYMFTSCYALKTLDLSGFDFSNCSSAYMFIDGCNNLETIKTPVNVQCSISLPVPYMDEDGNIYTELPKDLSESITLTRAEASEWLHNYKYEVTDDSIILLEFTGYFDWTYDDETGESYQDATVTVPGSAYIGEKTYKIVLSKDIWQYKGVTELDFEQGVFLPEDCSDLFKYDSLKKIDLSEVNVTNATDMSSMLVGCPNLTTIAVPEGVSLDSYLPGLFADDNGNTYTALPMNVNESFTITKTEPDGWLSDYDFYFTEDTIVLTGYHGDATDLTVPGDGVIGNKNFAKVEITPEMEWNEVTQLSFDKGVVVPENCSGMFNWYSLESIDMSNIDTSHVTDMSEMFSNRYLKELNLSGFDTSKVTDMSEMFYNCRELTSLDVSGFKTSNVTNMDSMFRYCGNLSKLDVSGFDTSKVTDMDYMFFSCSKITTLDVSGFNTENVESMVYMFNACKSVLELDLSRWNLASLTNAHRAFNGTIPVIKAPANLTVDVELLANYSGSDGNPYTSLPLNADKSILLTWVSASGDPGVACTHVYGEWVVTKEASCTEAGSRYHVCTRCGNKVTETIKANGHKWNEAYTIDKEATCTENGSESHHCTVCGESDAATAVVIPAKGHKWSGWTVTKAATRTENGSRERVCSICKEKETQTIPKLVPKWEKDSTGWRYNYGNGTYPVNKFEKIDGKTYYFNEAGYRITGWKKIGNYWYYFNNDGTMHIGWRLVGSTWYYFNGEGHLLTGLQKVNGYWYYFNGNGARQYSWQKIGNYWYYFDSDGKMHVGWRKVGSTWYYFNGEGHLLTGLQKVNGYWYYFNGNGARQTSWQKIGNYWYYFDSDGKMHIGWRKVGDIWYYFGGDGHLLTGKQKVNGYWYYFNGNGARQTGWQTIGGNRYYFESDGKMHIGWRLLNGSWYYFNAEGVMLTGRQYVNGKWYTFSSSGVRL